MTDKAGWQDQSGWINKILAQMQKNPTHECILLVKGCGRGCAECGKHIDGVMPLQTEAKHCQTPQECSEYINAHFPIQTEPVSDGVLIHYHKTKCTCRMAPDVANPMLCYCTVGHEEAMWSALFGRPIKAEIVESILRGGSDCVVKLFV